MQYALLWLPVVGLIAAGLLYADAAAKAPHRLKRGHMRGHWAVGVAFAAFVTFYLAQVLSWPAFDSWMHALGVGAGWALATLLVEITITTNVLHWSWAEAIAPYDLRAGRAWGAVIAWIAVLPLVLRWVTT